MNDSTHSPKPKGRILVVDDTPPNVELLEAYLTAEGYGVLPAYSGAEALQQVEEDPPDLILLDIMMPGIDGLQVCRQLKGDPRTLLIPVVMVTALKAREDRIRAIEAGADDFLSKPVDRVELLARVKSLLRVKYYTDELEHAETVLETLALTVEAKDPYTEGHCERLSDYGVHIGQRVGLSPDYLKALQQGGALHDIGKIGIPESILLKPGRLTEEEFELMKQHPIIGERICKPLHSLRLVLPIIRHHHERMDGSGYPDGLRGEEIPITARITSVVDVYDALTTERPYKPAFSKEKSIAILREEAKKGCWDSDLVEELVQVVQ